MKPFRTTLSNQTGKTSLRKVSTAVSRCGPQLTFWPGLSLLDRDPRPGAALWINSERVLLVFKFFRAHDISCEEVVDAEVIPHIDVLCRLDLNVHSGGSRLKLSPP